MSVPLAASATAAASAGVRIDMPMLPNKPMELAKAPCCPTDCATWTLAIALFGTGGVGFAGSIGAAVVGAPSWVSALSAISGAGSVGGGFAVLFYKRPDLMELYLEQMKTLYDGYKEQFDRQGQFLADSRRSEATANARAEELSKQAGQLNGLPGRVADETAKLTAERDRLTAELVDRERRIKELTEALGNTNARFESLSKTHSDLIASLEKATKTLGVTNASAGSQAANLGEVVVQLSAHITELTAKNAEKSKEKQSLIDLMRNFRDMIAQLDKASQGLQLRIEQLTKQLDELHSKASVKQPELDKQLAALAAENRTLNEGNDKLTKLLSERTRTLETLKELFKDPEVDAFLKARTKKAE